MGRVRVKIICILNYLVFNIISYFVSMLKVVLFNVIFLSLSFLVIVFYRNVVVVIFFIILFLSHFFVVLGPICRAHYDPFFLQARNSVVSPILV